MDDDDKYKKIGDTINYFNRQVMQVFKFIDSMDDYKDNELLNKVLILAKATKAIEPAEMLERCIDKLWDNREAIIDKNIDFFKKPGTMHQYIKDDENKEWLTGLTDFVMDQYDNFNDDELDEIWTRINNMLKAVVEYRILTDK